MKKLVLLFCAALLCVSGIGHAQNIKVACVGNSVTYGYGIADREHFSYPAQLQSLLGTGYEVRNFGHSSATLTHRSPMWYQKLPEFPEALKWKPDIVVIHLGLNDTDPRWWPNYADEFIPDYRALIDSFRVANPKARIWVCLMTPIMHPHHRFQSGTRDWHYMEQQVIAQIARGAGAGLIDLYTPLHSRPDLFPDALHPNAEGAGIMASTIRSYLTGDWGGLSMPITYGDNMVLQRDRAITISGTANAGDEVKVRLAAMPNADKQTKASLSGVKAQKAVAGVDGKWNVSLPALPMGGPYTLTISTAKRTLTYNNVWMGDVWLCSGQSNMEFRVSQSTTAKKDLDEAPQQQRLHILNLSPIASTGFDQWPLGILDSVNSLHYLRTDGWQPAATTDFRNFSAVAYHFGKALLDSLPNLHIGLIANSVGGTPIEAWIDRSSLEWQYPQILYNWKKNDHIQDWVRERGTTNTKLSSNPLQRHPYEPAYMFEAGIQPLQNTALKGVIWYQGESNANNTELHERLFPMFVNSWRKWFKDESLPVYFVQLSSLIRPSWPHFRNSQRLLADDIPNVWMAVSSDVGDSTDVHPRNKLAVGQRLAFQALAHSYGHTLTPQGPEPVSFRTDGHDIVVSFRYGDGLHAGCAGTLATRTDRLVGFELAGDDGLYYPCEAVVEGNSVRVKGGKQVSHPVSVRYGWQPFTRANLYNAANLPASTFLLPSSLLKDPTR